jgi:hypothetical protein
MRHNRELRRLSSRKLHTHMADLLVDVNSQKGQSIRQDFALLTGKVQYGRSSQDLVSHAAVCNRADKLFGINVIWESEIDLARLVECFYLFR